ncbi:MAG: hypothetical protein HYX87_09205 [Chloroflexi bacterium]|nr:hypothetical protein [Chloroflexota bacterium]
MRCNQAAEALLDIRAQDFVGKPVHEFDAALARKVTDVPSLVSAWKNAISRLSEMPKVEFDIVTGAAKRSIEVMLFPVGGPSGWLGTGVLLRDVTSEREVTRLKNEFVSMVAHELRSPLTAIIGCLRTTLSEGERLSPEENSRLVNDAVLEAESMNELIGNLLDLTRAEAKRLVLQNTAVDIVDVLSTVCQKVQTVYPRHDFVVGAGTGIPSVRGDRLRLERVVYNLLDNAGKYSSAGSTVRASAEVGEELVVSISDKGRSIPADDQAKLFEPFERLGRRGAGTGIGLVVCRTLVEAHGGRIWVESEPGKGSTFYFTLPLDSTKDQHPSSSR